MGLIPRHRRRTHLDTMRDDDLAGASGPDDPEEPAVLEEIEVEDLAVDGICGVY